MTIVLIYPSFGFVGAYVKNIPISLLYVATEVVKREAVKVVIVDFRIEENPFQKIRSILNTEDVLLVGISVMSGVAVKDAVEISKLIKKDAILMTY